MAGEQPADTCWNGTEIRILQREYLMLWCIPGCISLIYFIAVKVMSSGERFSAVWLLLALFFFGMAAFRVYRRRHPSGRSWPLWLRTFCVTTAALAVLLIAVTGARVIARMPSNAAPGADFLIILSEIDIPGEDEEELAERLDCAITYLEDNPDTNVIVSGGWEASRGSSKSQVMYQYLVRNGIDPERFYWETSGRSTRDNLQACINIMGTADADVVLLSSDYFAYRALRIARGLGMTSVSSLSPVSDAWLWPQRVMSEILMVLHDKLLLM